MDFADLLSADRIRCQVELKSKKRALQTLAELLGTAVDSEELSTRAIFDALVGRERLGSTGLGHGVALPHARITGVHHPVAALLTLREGVDFESPDGVNVDIVTALLVPEHCSEEHLQILAMLARRFSEPRLRDDLRACEPRDVDALLEHLRRGASAA